MREHIWNHRISNGRCNGREIDIQLAAQDIEGSHDRTAGDRQVLRREDTHRAQQILREPLPLLVCGQVAQITSHKGTLLVRQCAPAADKEVVELIEEIGAASVDGMGTVSHSVPREVCRTSLDVREPIGVDQNAPKQERTVVRLLDLWQLGEDALADDQVGSKWRHTTRSALPSHEFVDRVLVGASIPVLIIADVTTSQDDLPPIVPLV